MSVKFIRKATLAVRGALTLEDMPEYYGKSVIIFGCGNILFGDDGFGPAVIEELEREYSIPDHVSVINAGTSIRMILFNITLEEKKPDKVVIIDAMDVDRPPGEIFTVNLDRIPKKKIDDFSMHQIPTSNLLRELRDYSDVDVEVLACQVEKIPEEVEPGLSDTLKAKVPEMAELIVKKYFKIQ